MASYKVLERDEHGYTTHYMENGVEIWLQNFYTEEGKFKDLRIIHSRVPSGYRSVWFNKVYENGYDRYSKYNEKGDMIAEYCTEYGTISQNWAYSNWHCNFNKIKDGLSETEYKEWLKEIGVNADESSTD